MNDNDNNIPSQEDMARGVAFTQGQDEIPATPVTNIRQGVTYLDDKLTPIEYDTQVIEDFLDVVFHTELVDGEHICCYFDPKNQGFPIEEEAFFSKLERTKQPAKL